MDWLKKKCFHDTEVACGDFQALNTAEEACDKNGHSIDKAKKECEEVPEVTQKDCVFDYCTSELKQVVVSAMLAAELSESSGSASGGSSGSSSAADKPEPPKEQKCGNVPGYKLKPGNVWGQGVLGDGTIVHKDTAADCAEFCENTLKCLSFEYNPEDKICNLNKVCEPEVLIGKGFPGFDFCAKDCPSDWEAPAEPKVECPDGYSLKPGNIWGQGIFGNHETITKDSIDGCAKLCEEQEGYCQSFEYSPEEKMCNLNTKCQPEVGPFKDYLFCAKDCPADAPKEETRVIHCPAGTDYLLHAGNVPGVGKFGDGTAIFKESIEECMSLCDQTEDCLSFEFSPEERNCNLNKACKPSAPAFSDYLFCAKPCPGSAAFTKSQKEQKVALETATEDFESILADIHSISHGGINFTSMQKVNDVEAKMAKALDSLKRISAGGVPEGLCSAAWKSTSIMVVSVLVTLGYC